MFQQMEDTFFPTTEARLPVITRKLPPGNYHIAYTPAPQSIAHLVPVEPFAVIDRYYGDLEPLAARIIHTYHDRPRNTGVLLHGIKGSGKTLLAKLICIKMKCPVLIIHEPVSLNTLVQMLNAIPGDCVVLFDEFEKNFSSFGDRDEDDDSRKPAQDKILSVLDGVYSGKKLFLLTVNDKFLLSNFLLNRPGRLFYSIEFNGLEPEFVREYCQERLTDQSKTEDVAQLSAIAHKFTFDALQAVVEELNRYNESVQQAVRMLNLELLEGSTGKFDVVAVDAQTKKQIVYQQNLGDINDFKAWMAVPDENSESGKGRVLVSADNLVKFDGKSFVLQVQHFVLKLTRQDEVSANEKLLAGGYDAAFQAEDLTQCVYSFPEVGKGKVDKLGARMAEMSEDVL